MKRIYLLTVLILLCISIALQAQEEIKETPKLKKNTVYLQLGNSQLFESLIGNTINLMVDLHYTRNFSKLFRGNIGFKLNNYYYPNTNEFNIDIMYFYIGGGVDIKLCKNLYLIPNINIGVSELPYNKLIENELFYWGGYWEKTYRWNAILVGDLDLEYRLKNWRFLFGLKYDYIFQNKNLMAIHSKNKNLYIKLGAGFSF